MEGLARYFRRAGGDRVENAIHELGASHDLGDFWYRLKVEHTLSFVWLSNEPWNKKVEFYDRIAGKLIKSNRVHVVNEIYSTANWDTNLIPGTGKTMSGNPVRHIELLRSLIRRGVLNVTVNLQGMMIIHSLLFDRTDSIPDTLRFLDTAMELGADINEVTKGWTPFDRLDQEIRNAAGERNELKRQRLEGLRVPLYERGARSYEEITRTPEDIFSIVNKEGLWAELYRIKFPSYMDAGTQPYVFGIPARYRPEESDVFIVKDRVYIYTTLQRNPIRVGDIEIRNAPQRVDVPIDLAAAVAVPVPLSVGEVEGRIRAVALPDLRVQLRSIKDGAGTTLAGMAATYRLEDSDDVFIVNGMLRVLVKNGLVHLTNANTMNDAITLQPIPATRRRRRAATRKTNKRRSRRNYKRSIL